MNGRRSSAEEREAPIGASSNPAVDRKVVGSSPTGGLFSSIFVFLFDFVEYFAG